MAALVPARDSDSVRSGGVRGRRDGGRWFVAVPVEDGGPDVFAHYSAIQTSGYRSLEENQKVQFDVTQGPKGPQAENVRPV